MGFVYLVRVYIVRVYSVHIHIYTHMYLTIYRLHLCAWLGVSQFRNAQCNGRNTYFWNEHSKGSLHSHAPNASYVRAVHTLLAKPICSTLVKKMKILVGIVQTPFSLQFRTFEDRWYYICILYYICMIYIYIWCIYYNIYIYIIWYILIYNIYNVWGLFCINPAATRSVQLQNLQLRIGISSICLVHCRLSRTTSIILKNQHLSSGYLT